jgi:hypothetical protein
MRFLYLIIIGLVLGGCSSDAQLPENITDKYAKLVIKDLEIMANQSRLTLVRSVAIGEKIETQEMVIDTMKNQDAKLDALKSEYVAFLNIETESLLKNMNFTVDSGGEYESRNYFNKDTTAFLQEFKILKSRGQLQGYFWKTRQRNWLVDRDIENFYLPQKGYVTQIIENTWWKSPERINIQLEVLGPQNAR